MTQLITDNLRRLPIVDQLLKLSEAYDSKFGEAPLDNYIYDSVRDFIDTITSERTQFEKNYLIRLFYCNKGTTEIFELLKTHLDIDVSYTYDGVNLDLVIHTISTTDPNLLDHRFTQFLYHLVYYHELSIIYETLIFLIKQKLGKVYTKIDVITYKTYIATL